MLTGGQVADCTAGEALLERLPHCDILHADKGYDANAIRQQVERRGTMPNIPPKANRKWKNCFSPFLYRNRNAIERMFCRLKDFRRVATRYDRNAVNFLAAVCIAAALDPREVPPPAPRPEGLSRSEELTPQTSQRAKATGRVAELHLT